MGQKVFVPVTDEILYDYPELIRSPLRPYHYDNPCFHWMATIESDEPAQNQTFDHRSMANKSTRENSLQSGSRFA